MMEFGFSHLKEKLTRDFSFISAIESESEFYLELVNYLSFLLSDMRLSYIISIILRDAENAKEHYEKSRKESINLLVKTRNQLEALLVKNGNKEDAENIFSDFDKLIAGTMATSAVFEIALERKLYDAVYKIVNDYPTIKLHGIAEPRDDIGNWIFVSPLKESLEKCKEDRNYFELERRIAVWGAWERLQLMLKALFSTDKTIQKAYKTNLFHGMAFYKISNEMKNIVNKEVFQQNKRVFFDRKESLNDLTRVHNFVLDNMDKTNLGFVTLKRFKQRCEWFDKERLVSLIVNESAKYAKIEEKLTQELSKYLHDNCILPFSEVSFGKIRPDVLGLYSGQELFPIEVKVIKSNEIERVKKGFNQIMSYLETIDVSEGFYVIYCLGDFILDIPSSVFRNQRRINIITINLSEIAPSTRKAKIRRITDEQLSD